MSRRRLVCLLETLEPRRLLSYGFSPPVVTTLGSAGVVAAGDFNHDGVDDLMVRSATNATPASTVPSVRAHLGLGHGRFSAHGFPVWSGESVSSIALGDLNRDGNLDAAFANDREEGTVTFAFGRGDGTFGGPGVLPVIISAYVGANPKSITVADFNDDGALDVLAANAGPWTPLNMEHPPLYGAGLLLGNGNGFFQPAVQMRLGEPQSHVATGDVNGDGNVDAVFLGPDLLSLSPIPQTAVHTVLQDDQGHLSLLRQPLFPFRAGGLVVQDLNGDHRADLAALQVLPTPSNVAGAGVVHTFVSGGAATTTPQFTPVASAATGLVYPAGLSAADFDGNGKLDFAVAGVSTAAATNAAHGTVAVLAGRGGGLLAPARYFLTYGRPLSQTLGDFDGNGRRDVVTGSAGGVAVLLGRQAAPFAAVVGDDLLDLEKLAAE